MLRWMSRISDWAIIMPLVFVGLIAAIVLNWNGIFPEERPPVLLSGLPGVATEIVDVGGSDFFEATPYVRIASGEVFLSTWAYDGYAWEATEELPALVPDRTCAPGTTARLEESAGPVEQCVAFTPFGEFCPPPLTSFAIDRDGAVWRLEQPRPCVFFFGLSLFFFPALGFSVGLILVVLRWLAHLVLKRI